MDGAAVPTLGRADLDPAPDGDHGLPDVDHAALSCVLAGRGDRVGTARPPTSGSTRCGRGGA
jgi:hypothetical protein